MLDAAVAGVRGRRAPTGRCWTGDSPPCSSSGPIDVAAAAAPAQWGRGRGGAGLGCQRAGVPDRPARRSARLLPRRGAGRGARGRRRPRPPDRCRRWTPPRCWPGGPRCSDCRRGGRVSAGGATRLLPARDGWCAVTLSRPDDVDAVPALVEREVAPDDPWPAVETWAASPARRRGRRARPAARLARGGARRGCRRPARRAARSVRRRRPAPPSGPAGRRHVVDVGGSAVRADPGAGRAPPWSRSRAGPGPDGTRAGPAAFFDWMNGGKLCYAADFDDAAALRALLAAADVVISRRGPRRCTGAASARRRPARDGRVWLRITGHGADGTAPTGRRSATTPRWRVGWSAAAPRGRCSAATPSPIRSPACTPRSRSPRRWPAAAVSSSTSRWPRSPRRTRRCPQMPERKRLCRNRHPRTPVRSSAAAELGADNDPGRPAGQPNGGFAHADSACTPARRHRGRHPGRASHRRGRRATSPRRAARRCSTPPAAPSSPACTITTSTCTPPPRPLTSVSVGPREVHGRDDLARVLAERRRRRGRLDQGRRLPRSRRGAAGPRGARRGVARRARARAAPQRDPVDAELGGAGQRRAARPSRRPAAQRRPELVERPAAPGKRARRGQSPAGVLRRHRSHRCHTRSRRRPTW